MQKNNLTLPAAIIIAGALIGLAILFTRMSPTNGKKVNDTVAQPAKVLESGMPAVTEKDYLFGNPDASVIVVEYSDASCPFCKMLHTTVSQLMDDYGKAGKVAFVYRHFPLDEPNEYGQVLHPNAGNEAHAFECAGDVGGNAKYFEYINKFYNETPSVTGSSPDGFDQTQLPVLAKSIGLDENKFKDCMSSGKFKEKIEEEYQGGLYAGVAGTPFLFVVTKSGKSVPINGAQPMNVIKAVIDKLLAEEK